MQRGHVSPTAVAVTYYTDASLRNWIFSTLVNHLFGTRYTNLCYGYNAFWDDISQH